MKCKFCGAPTERTQFGYPMDCGAPRCAAEADSVQRAARAAEETAAAEELWHAWLRDNDLGGYDHPDDGRSRPLSDFIAAWTPGRSAWIASRQSGIGKTWALVRLARRAKLERGLSVGYLDSAGLASYAASHGDAKEAKADSFRGKKLLILDDLDKMMRTEKSRLALWEIVKAAADAGAAFLSSSNMRADDICAWLGVGKMPDGSKRTQSAAQAELASECVPLFRRIRENSTQLET